MKDGGAALAKKPADQAAGTAVKAKPKPADRAVGQPAKPKPPGQMVQR